MLVSYKGYTAQNIGPSEVIITDNNTGEVVFHTCKRNRLCCRTTGDLRKKIDDYIDMQTHRLKNRTERGEQIWTNKMH